MTMSVPGPKAGSRPPAALVRTTIRAPEPPEQQHGLDDEARVVALVQVEAALEHDDRPPAERAEQQPADVARRGRGRPAGQVGERDRDGVLEVVGEAAEPGAEDDPDLGHEVGPGADGRLERVEARRLVERAGSGAPGPGASTASAGRRDRACGPPGSHPGVDGRWPAGFAGPTEVPTPGCRSRPVGPPRGRPGRRPSRPGKEAPEATGAERKVLDVISVPRSWRPLRARRTVRAGGRDGSTRLSTNSAPGAGRAVHELSAACGQRCGQSLAPTAARARQPPRANISILGRSPSPPPAAPSSDRPRAPRSPAMSVGQLLVGRPGAERPRGGRARRPRRGRCTACPRPRAGPACSRRRTAGVTEAMTPISPAPSTVAPAIGDLAAVVRRRRLERPARRRSSSTISAAGTTSSSRQPFECPTSMYSMNRRIRPASRAQRAIGTTLASLLAAPDDHVDLDRREAGLDARRRSRRAPARPGSRRRSSRRKVSSSSESRETVTRRRPASASGAGERRSAEPFVVSVRSSSPPSGVGARRASRRAPAGRAGRAARRR